MIRVWCDVALIDGRPQRDVAIAILDGRFESVETGVGSTDLPAEVVRLDGFTVAGFANAHSHAFHRVLRSRTQADRGTFWTWRELMYHAAARLTPDTYHRLARATFAEMALAGITCVGEFHYVHHQLDGSRYSDANEMSHALIAAADEAGIRITLLDTLYLHGGLGANGYVAPTGVQRRFDDRTADAWVDRVAGLSAGDRHRLGVAIHSSRAVDPLAARVAAEWAASQRAPIHAHVSEQVAENEVCQAHHGMTPVQLLAEANVISERFSAVHATHLDPSDIETLADAGSTIVMCPTTERDLGDGIARTDAFADAGMAIALGSDSHAVIDMFEEARCVELHERLRSQCRGRHSAGDLLTMGTVSGHRSLGWDDAGTIEAGKRADLVTVSLDSVRTAGTPTASAVAALMFAATASDVTNVFVDGHHLVTEGRHTSIDVVAELDASIKELMDHD